MGVSRSVSIVVAYLITVTDMHLDRAHEFVRERRFFANPNVGFREQLKRYYSQVGFVLDCLCWPTISYLFSHFKTDLTPFLGPQRTA